MTTAHRRGPWFLVLALLVSGCGGGGFAAVQGTVTLDGASVENGFISFIPADPAGGPTGRVSIVKHNYTIDSTGQLKPGAYRVEIHAQRKTGKQIPVGSPAPPGTMIEEEVEAIPEKYNKQTTLQQELKAGQNTFNFELTSPEK